MVRGKRVKLEPERLCWSQNTTPDQQIVMKSRCSWVIEQGRAALREFDEQPYSGTTDSVLFRWIKSQGKLFLSDVSNGIDLWEGKRQLSVSSSLFTFVYACQKAISASFISVFPQVFRFDQEPVRIDFDISFFSSVLNQDEIFNEKELWCMKVIGDCLRLGRWSRSQSNSGVKCEFALLWEQLKESSIFHERVDLKEPEGFCGELLSFQKAALKWMIDREQGSLATDNTLHPLLTELPALNGSLFYNEFNGRFSENCVQFDWAFSTIRGGCLCQEMGLGKTVELIALILSNPCFSLNECVKATVVVCPSAIIQQWRNELNKFGPDLKVLVFSERPKFFDLPTEMEWRMEMVSRISTSDVILVAYEFLVKEAHFHGCDQRSLEKGHDFLPRAIFHGFKFWRLILDESQKTTGQNQASDTIFLLDRCITWLVSATPAKDFSHFQPMFQFLGDNLFGSRKWYKFFIRDLFHSGNADAVALFKKSLNALLLIETKEFLKSSGELFIPELEIQDIKLEFETGVEHELYSRLFSSAEEHYRNHLQDLANSKHLFRLLELRQSCCHPFLSRNRDVVKFYHQESTKATSIDQVQDFLTTEAEARLDEAHRRLFRILNQTALRHFLDENYVETAKIYSFIGPEINTHVSHLAETMLFQARELISGSDLSVENLESIKKSAAAGAYLEYHLDLKQSMQYYQYAVAACFNAISNSRITSDRKENDVDSFRENGQSELLLKFSRELTRIVLILLSSERIHAETKSIEELQALSQILSRELKRVETELDQAVAETGRNEIYWEVRYDRRRFLQDLLVMHLYVLRILTEVKFENLDYLNELQSSSLSRLKTLDASAYSTFQETERENTLRGEGSTKFFRFDLDTIEWMRLAHCCLSGMLRVSEKLKKESNSSFSQDSALLRTKMHILYLVSGSCSPAFGPSLMSWMSILFHFTRGKLALREATVAYDEEAESLWEIAYAIRDDIAFDYRTDLEVEDVWSKKTPFNTTLRSLQHQAENARHDIEIRERELRYIATKFSITNDCSTLEENCPICLNDILYPVLTRCGHVFCRNCLQRIFKGTFGVGQCPLCRRNINRQTCFLVSERPNYFGQEIEDLKFTGNFGTKVNFLLRKVKQILKNDHTAKIVVFSQWSELLRKIGLAFEQNSLPFVMLSGSSSRKSMSINRFQDDSRVGFFIACRFFDSLQTIAFLVPMTTGSSGLNLVQANHAFIMEPNLNVFIEKQAVGRIHRIGQKRKTTVYRLVMKNTVEERIHLLQQDGSQDSETLAQKEKIDASILSFLLEL